MASEQLLYSQAANWKLKQEGYWKDFQNYAYMHVVSDFKEASRNLILNFLHIKTANIVKTISAYTQNTDF